MSRTSVREALRSLQASGIVKLVPPRGVVRGPTSREIREAYLVRADLEELAALEAQWIRDDQLKRLREAEERFRRSVEELATSRRARAVDETEPSDEPWFRATRSSTSSCRRLPATSGSKR